MKQSARKILLPRLEVTELAEPADAGAFPVLSANTSYFVRAKHEEGSQHSKFNLFPVVLDASGVPWAEANIYLLARVESSSSPSMATYASIADSLAAYRRFLDETGIDWTLFPTNKLNRPTYRYRGFLKLAVAAGEIAMTTAKRRMSAIISFYSWLRDEKVLLPQNAPWKESDRYLELMDGRGFKFSKRVTTTDIAIKVFKQNDPYAGTIDDSGKLRPLSQEEQSWLIDALLSLGNTEMTLIHLFGMLTGARIQTILTFRVRHAMLELNEPAPIEVRFPVGPGTGIDTKNDKQMVLFIPFWFYQLLRTYAQSERAQRRRSRAMGGDTQDQYLFLSVRGAPMYTCKSESKLFNDSNLLRHEKSGQGVRQFIKERVIPYIRKNNNAPSFRYQFHDTRASFGMNLTDYQLDLVSKGDVTLHQAREFVKTRMCHESSGTTDRYLQYRSNLKFIEAVSSDYHNHLRDLAKDMLRKSQ